MGMMNQLGLLTNKDPFQGPWLNPRARDNGR